MNKFLKTTEILMNKLTIKSEYIKKLLSNYLTNMKNLKYWLLEIKLRKENLMVLSSTFALKKEKGEWLYKYVKIGNVRTSTATRSMAAIFH